MCLFRRRSLQAESRGRDIEDQDQTGGPATEDHQRASEDSATRSPSEIGNIGPQITVNVGEDVLFVNFGVLSGDGRSLLRLSSGFCRWAFVRLILGYVLFHVLRLAYEVIVNLSSRS
ncbi:hypothetical protein K488DRAFT_92562 [Vararia minispora EC-137]|uniref:Uncharacterized protein n=1 Tax=Vararia minispora EC-137 TaxID=1314806 RepID=A0ACB8Q3Z1_9AGAM|nr:hypothetical protein K488DRAFT_92562 [Vararia minispora EC-137]